MRVSLIVTGLLGLLVAPGAGATVIFPSDGSYSVTCTTCPNGTGTVPATIGGTTNVEGLTLTDTITPTGSNGAWIDFNFVGTGPSLAQNTAAAWEIQINGAPLTAPGLFDNFFLYWTLDGTAINPIQSFGGITSEGTTTRSIRRRSRVRRNSVHSRPADHLARLVRLGQPIRFRDVRSDTA
jgi:hypothetical protein